MFSYFLIFCEFELSGSNIKKLLIFSQKKAFLISQETEIHQKIPYISGNGTITSYISGSNFPSLKNIKIKKRSEKLSYISGTGTFQPQL